MTKEIERIGIVGGGQLGRMLTEAAIPMGFDVTVTNPGPNGPAAQVGAREIVAELDDVDAIEKLAKETDVLTWEIEHIPSDFLTYLRDNGTDVQPNPNTLAIIQDKLVQKQFLQDRGIPVGPFSESFDENVFSSGPYMIKSRTGGYDGRGNLVVDSLDDPAILAQFGNQAVYVEQMLPFDKELSVVAARDLKGNIKIYPVVETEHRDNICHIVSSPANIGKSLRQQAMGIAQATLSNLEGAGVFAIEMFVVGDAVLVNEIAPRVHNSGHHTIEANMTSQFEQHIRAISGLPLGDVIQLAPAATMVNILGTKQSDTLDQTGHGKALQLPDTYVHFYGKTPRIARKIGHITALADTMAEARTNALAARDFFTEV